MLLPPPLSDADPEHAALPESDNTWHLPAELVVCVPRVQHEFRSPAALLHARNAKKMKRLEALNDVSNSIIDKQQQQIATMAAISPHAVPLGLEGVATQ